MQWLNEYTFPCEAGMQKLQDASDVYRKAVKRLLTNGTTCAVYFGSLHLQPTKLLVDIVRDMGQRAFIGKVHVWGIQNAWCSSIAMPARPEVDGL